MTKSSLYANGLPDEMEVLPLYQPSVLILKRAIVPREKPMPLGDIKSVRSFPITSILRSYYVRYANRLPGP